MKNIDNAIYIDGSNIYTKNLVKGKNSYGEALVNINGVEYRTWNPYRSKLAAFLLLENFDLTLKPNSRILYLGASTGTTVSHISDMVPTGKIYAVEISKEPFLKLYNLSGIRTNIYPILADASQPDKYVPLITSVNFVYQDVAQYNQVEILEKNVNMYLDAGGQIILMIKLKSISSTIENEVVERNVQHAIEKSFVILRKRYLDIYEKDHIAYLLKLKN